MYDTDVFVIGGGPAGLAAALAARRKGFRVMVADAACPPIDKACGEGLMPDSLASLRTLGVSLGGESAHSFPFRGIRFLESGVSFEADFPDGCGLGVRRTALHAILAGHAARVGVRLLWGARVTGVFEGRVLMDGREVRARWIVGADGTNSRVRAWAGLDTSRRQSSRFGFRRHYAIAPWSNYVEIYWGTGAQIYVTPAGSECVSVALIAGDRHARLDTQLARFPEIRMRLDGVPAINAERGAVTVSRRLGSVCRGNVALVGDASGSVDAITGEGLCLAFRQALALADSMERGDLTHYQTEHRRLVRRPAFMAALMLGFDARPRLRARAFRALAAKPHIFAGMLAMHVGELSVPAFAVNGLNLAWQMIAA